MYKAIFIDIDGTLRNSKRQISIKTVQSIKNITQKGTLIILCSGRPRKYTEEVSRSCFASKYIITSNGGAIYDYETKEKLYEESMKKSSVIKLYKIAEKSNSRFVMNSGDDRVVNRFKYLDSDEIKLETSIETFVEKNDIVQCTISDEDFDKIKNLRKEIENVEHVEIKNEHRSLFDKNYPKIGSIYYDIADEKVSKGYAIKQFCNIKKIDLKDTIAIGDCNNDISMFKVVGHSVAVENATSEAKKYANEIIKSNNEDGVALFLESLNL